MKFAMSMAFSDPSHWLPMARAADDAGWDLALVSDHVVHPETIESPYPYTDDAKPRWDAPTPWPDPWVAIGAMAAVTERLRFCTGIYVLPMRNPFVVAKAVGTAAVLSGNRVTLGMGVGWMKEEFDLLEQPFARRGRRADEMLEVMRKLWTGEVVEHRGEFYDFAPLSMTPAPSQPIPVIVGGLSEPALRRAARLGDGWISDLHTTDEMREIATRLHALRREAGRADEPFDIVAACIDASDADGYRRVADAGVTTLQTMPWLFYSGLTGDLQEKLDGIRRFADDVFPKLRP
ncbi:MAG: LLM class F420-dependent oxidoreductase [Deltaproteobacteria bacterium]|nr:LLM class F420-dependent oxidoreductase [Deltaproteobacteria bacterium]